MNPQWHNVTMTPQCHHCTMAHGTSTPHGYHIIMVPQQYHLMSMKLIWSASQQMLLHFKTIGVTSQQQGATSQHRGHLQRKADLTLGTTSAYICREISLTHECLLAFN